MLYQWLRGLCWLPRCQLCVTIFNRHDPTSYIDSDHEADNNQQEYQLDAAAYYLEPPIDLICVSSYPSRKVRRPHVNPEAVEEYQEQWNYKVQNGAVKSFVVLLPIVYLGSSCSDKGRKGSRICEPVVCQSLVRTSSPKIHRTNQYVIPIAMPSSGSINSLT